MTVFRGPKNLQLGLPVWASASYDHASREYVIELDGDDADRFRVVAALYDYREAEGHERDYVDLAYAIDNARDDDELDEPGDEPDGDDDADDETPAAGAARRK